MYNTSQATDVQDIRQRHAAELSVLVAKMNTAPEDAGPVTKAIERVLDIASCLPGGQHALIDGLRSSSSAQEVLAFCKAFVHTMGVAAAMGEFTEAVQDAAIAV